MSHVNDSWQFWTPPLGGAVRVVMVLCCVLCCAVAMCVVLCCAVRVVMVLPG